MPPLSPRPARRFPALIAIAVLSMLLASGCSRLGAFNAITPQDQDARIVARDIAYGDDARQRLDIYAPAAGKRRSPVIVFTYGGSWNSGARRDYEFVGRAFASRGFVTVIYDYRLVPKIRYPDFVKDAAKATAWTRRNIDDYGGDPQRLYLVGHSAGAYNAMMVALAPEFLAAEGLPVGTVKAVVGISGPYDFLPLSVDETREAFAGVRNLERTQPINRARTTRSLSPILLLHGEDDTFVLPRNSAALAKTLRAGGHSVRDIYYPRVGHVGTLLAISQPLRDRAPVVDDIVDFLSTHGR